jgi:hypothetical protein
MPDLELRKRRPEITHEHAPLIQFLELLFPQSLEPLQLGAAFQLAIKLMVRTPVFPNDRKQLFR